ncbi:MAG: helix-turn-helix domain-containing protein [Candidatus Eremiobacteraeota bacterium]|nr:helix-turn-helix domain-containing protein [Candidatus Eremiobacteraeota bacterium]
MAEAVGVSRGWYAMLERGEPIQPSIAMLNRVAQALNATRDERVTLLQLAIPELQGLF